MYLVIGNNIVLTNMNGLGAGAGLIKNEPFTMVPPLIQASSNLMQQQQQQSQSQPPYHHHHHHHHLPQQTGSSSSLLKSPISNHPNNMLTQNQDQNMQRFNR
jgi:hypothetical protein